MVNIQVTVNAEGGLHARPASLLVNTANKFSSSVKIVKDTKIADAKSILNIMTLGAKKGETLAIQIEGVDEQVASAELQNLFANNFEV
ncbi:HPr family phosphocarrier protein [Brevibacillus fluminis]|uniref:Phosphocarrier protein HPr n=1 Tax=Brevibacillus fluminis TaxID=511487 RepID=A0A3M8D5T7_9BACL|nr:HPr family phosphocarrier protein [Brevibacillus fluminis]RNB82787.1 HPr family phosphocarrier protein [Brevibacillus fluminis]